MFGNTFVFDILKVFFWSAVPLLEQRWAIPFGIIIKHMNPFLVFIISYLGSLLPAAFILLLFDKIFKFLKRYKFFAGIYNLIQRKIDKNREKFEKYGEIALITFIGIPLPTTGVWTGSAIAAFLKLDFKKSMICAATGAFISAVLITIMSIAFPAMLGY